MQAARERLLEQFRLVLSNSYLLESIETLHAGGVFQHMNLVAAGIDSLADKQAYYRPLITALKAVCAGAVNAKTLSIACWELSADLMPVVLAMPLLHTLKLMNCHFLSLPWRITQCPTILNARFVMGDASCVRCWQFVGGMSHLRVLSLVRTGSHNTPLFPLSLSGPNPFLTVEKLMVSGVNALDVSLLSGWIWKAKFMDERIRLTHLKLWTHKLGMEVEDINNLLDALQGSPLQCLSLEGVRCASPRLLVAIAQACPRLESLTLYYLQRDHLDTARSGPAQWPGATWEYAEALRHFGHLKRFLWNQSLSYETPSGALIFMEKDWNNEEIPEEAWCNFADLMTDYDDGDCVARLFAVNCQSLESVTFLEGCPCFHYWIRRYNEGEHVHVIPEDRWSIVVLDLIESVNPFVDGGWPSVYSPALIDSDNEEGL